MVISQCRLCQSKLLSCVIDLGFHPLADTFLYPEQLSSYEPTYPLRCLLCEQCGNVQTGIVPSREDRYQKFDYSYDSSNSKVSVKHFQEMAQQISKRAHLSPEDFVIDVGSNVGTLLGHLQQISGCRVMGVEPAPNIAKIANGQGVETLNQFFDSSAVQSILKKGRVKVITATNVFNHIEDIDAFMKTVDSVLTDDGHFVIEVPYLLDLVAQTAFDTIYLEHVSYFGIVPFVKYLNKNQWCISFLEKQDYMSGSIRIYISRGSQNNEIVQEFIDAEMNASLYSKETYASFMKRALLLKYRLNQKIYDIKAKGGKIVGIGAPAKGNTLLNYCKIDSDLLEFITDSSVHKIGKLTPGSHIRILDDDAITSDITHALILPWNIGKFLVKKLGHLNVEFLIPQLENQSNQGAENDRT